MVQPFPRVNFLENPGFEVVYDVNTLVFPAGYPCHSEEGVHVVHWWGNDGFAAEETFQYYPIHATGIATEQIEFKTDGERGNVIHFREGRDFNDYFLVYRRSASSCTHPDLQAIAIDPHQWAPADFELRFHAKGNAGDLLSIRVSASGEVKHGSLASGWEQTYNFTVQLGNDWQEHVIEMPNDQIAVKSVDLRFGLGESAVGEAWLDDVNLNDAHKWITASGESTEIDIHPEGELLVDGTPFAVRAIQDRYNWASPTSPGGSTSLEILRDRCQALGFGPGGMEFGTLLKPPSGFNIYTTKREARLVLDAAHTAGMKVILWLPLYPEQGNDRLPWVRGLVEEWVTAFNDHPALLGWTYGDEVSPSRVEQAVDWAMLPHYESIPAVQERFHPLFLYTSGFVFDEAPADWGTNTFCNDTRPAGCLSAMFDMGHVLMPNFFPLRSFADEVDEVVPLLARWCWSAATLHYVDRLAQEPSSSHIARAVLPVAQFRPNDCATLPPDGRDARLMAAQAAGSHGVGYLAQGIGMNVENPGDCIGPLWWDLIDSENRLEWDAQTSDAATHLFDAYPDANRMVQRIAEKRFAGDPSPVALPPKVVLQAAPKSETETWVTGDSWFSPVQQTPPGLTTLRHGKACNFWGGNCGGFVRLSFDDLSGAFDPARIEKAKLMLTIHELQLEPDANCDIRHCGYITPMVQVARIPQGVEAGDSLLWNHATDWGTFADRDTFEVFDHTYNKDQPNEEHVYDFGLQFLASHQRAYGSQPNVELLPGRTDRIVDFDLSGVVRHWVGDPNEDQRRNNGLFVQPHLPTLSYEPQLSFHSKRGFSGPNARKPALLIYDVPEGETPKALGAPFALFYEAPPHYTGGLMPPSAPVRGTELHHSAAAEAKESWLLAVNNDGLPQCLRIYSNRHPAAPDLQVFSATSGEQIGLAYPGETDARYPVYGTYGEYGDWDFCPETLTTGQRWHPEVGTDTYQPITRWTLELDGSYDDASIVLVRIPHPIPTP